ncbi:MAG: lipocalin family protein [Terrimicrobiaceae bacterium]
MRILTVTLLPLLAMLLASCATTPPPKTVDHLDLQKFMGDWYVISYLPWFAEKGNVNTMDIYELRPDGKINVTYAFRKKSLDAPRKEWRAKARVFNKETNAHWKIQLFPPFSADFLVIDLADDYRYTVVGGPSKNLVWIMSRKPTLAETDYQAIVNRLQQRGYDTSKLERVIQPTR